MNEFVLKSLPYSDADHYQPPDSDESPNVPSHPKRDTACGRQPKAETVTMTDDQGN
ncbi:hypothetical protein QR685DRAFT_516035 [Neurospora intermedia]|uniref:Uncharacterized protein n=1 Tax=Neurospora intermedia TaxID=5142 RepID=A0ABR3DKF8_NEUIN